MTYHIEFKPSAKKELAQLPRDTGENIEIVKIGNRKDVYGNKKDRTKRFI